MKYCDQSRKAIRTRHGGHLAHIKYGGNEKWRVAYYVSNLAYSADKSLLKGVKRVINRKLLDSYERLKRIESDSLMNTDRGLILIS